MNEKEKEAIEELKKQLRLAINIDDVTTAVRNDNAKTILNLIEKLQKENEELKEKYNKDTNQLQNQIYRLNVDKINNYISKAKIEKMYIEMEQEYERKVYDNNYNRTEVKKEEMYKRQVYEKLLESEE